MQSNLYSCYYATLNNYIIIKIYEKLRLQYLLKQLFTKNHKIPIYSQAHLKSENISNSLV